MKNRSSSETTTLWGGPAPRGEDHEKGEQYPNHWTFTVQNACTHPNVWGGENDK